jgi:hypothetical protein
MAKSGIDKVSAVFQGVGARDADPATNYMNPEKYIQHKPHAAHVEGVSNVSRRRVFFVGERNIFLDIFKFQSDIRRSIYSKQ